MIPFLVLRENLAAANLDHAMLDAYGGRIICSMSRLEKLLALNLERVRSSG